MTNQPQPFTLRSAAGLPSDPPPIGEATLLTIDVQSDYEPGGFLELPDHGEAIKNIAKLLSAARSQQSHVLHIAHQGKAGGLFDPAVGGRISTDAEPVGDETVIYKDLPNAFAGTDLHKQLQASGTNHIVLVGFMTHMCVSSTARAALDLGYATTVISDATATRDLPSQIQDSPSPLRYKTRPLRCKALASMLGRCTKPSWQLSPTASASSPQQPNSWQRKGPTPKSKHAGVRPQRAYFWVLLANR